MENKLLDADYTDEKFTIKIKVCKNGNIISVDVINNYQPTYQEIIGALEIVKFNYIEEQSKRNRKSKTAPKTSNTNGK